VKYKVKVIKVLGKQ